MHHLASTALAGKIVSIARTAHSHVTHVLAQGHVMQWAQNLGATITFLGFTLISIGGGLTAMWLFGKKHNASGTLCLLGTGGCLVVAFASTNLGVFGWHIFQQINQ
jgi:hypothetical protein